MSLNADRNKGKTGHSCIYLLLVCIFFIPVTAAGQSDTNDHISILPDFSYPVKQVDPPYLNFYTKLLDCKGIPIRSASVVSDSALCIASAKLQNMLLHMPAALQNLVNIGAELHIIGKDQQTSDLPEWAFQKNKPYKDNRGVVTDIDKRTRGLGTIPCSCGEENLLDLPSDRYHGGSDICIHEFAHNIMNAGLDPDLRRKISDQYKRALKQGLWNGCYATTNAGEYWAELSMWYFGAHGEFLKDTKIPAPGAEGLRNYDPDGYALLDAIYSGKQKIKRISIRSVSWASRSAISKPSDDEAQLLIENNSAKEFKLYWIDFKGDRKPYGSVPPFGRNMLSSYQDHVWVLVDDAGNDFAWFVADADVCVMKIAP